LSFLTISEIGKLLDALMEKRLIEQIDVDRFRPVVQLTESGSQVMKSQAPLVGPLPLPGYLVAKLRRTGDGTESPSAESREDSHDLPPPNPELLEALRKWRRDEADELGIPAYQILHTNTLEHIARIQPTTLEALERIKGIGPAKLDQYGATILKLVQRFAIAPSRSSPGAAAEFKRESPCDAPAPVRRRPGEENTNKEEDEDPFASFPIDRRPGFYWTWRVLSGGANLDECAAIRGMTPEQIFDHAVLAVEAGLAVQPRWILPAPVLELLQEKCQGSAAPSLRRLAEDLHGAATLSQIEVFLKCYTPLNSGGNQR
jgi:hypothetical protein